MFAGAVAAVLMQAGSPSAIPADSNLVRRPVWDRRPTADDLNRLYPKAAADALLAGTVLTRCTVTEAGTLTNCTVEAEDPAKAGFGAAAISLTALFRMKSLDADGASVAGRQVLGPIRFLKPADLRGAQQTLPPVGDAMGGVALNCRYQARRLDNCLTMGGSVQAVEAEARRRAAEMVLDTPRSRGRIAISFLFADPGKAGAPSIITMPDWRRRPTGNDMARVYPRRAKSKGLSGTAVTSCSVTKDGALAACRTLDEDPAGEGFGEAALKLMSLFQMRPMLKDGQPIDGGTVRIPIRFVLPR